MTYKWLSFDIETAKITEDGNNLEAERPLGICCWALAWETHLGVEIQTGHGLAANYTPTPRLGKYECQALVKKLRQLTLYEGYTLLTHNGVGFDLDILAEESGMHAECVELAMNSVDMMLQFHCTKGFPIGLDAIAKGMGLSGKTEGMSGSLAPVLWANGECVKVLEYVGQDVRSTLEVALRVEQIGELRWIAKSGRLNAVPFSRWMTVREALELPLPNVSWMTDAWPREKFTSWMAEAKK